MAMPKPSPLVAPSMLTARAAAAHLGVDERTIRRAIARGDLRAVKQSGAFQISPADLDQYRTRRSRSHGPATDNLDAHRHATTTQFGDRPLLNELSSPPLAVQPSLPIPLTSLVGRESEIAVLVVLLRGPDRLVTLTGPGGVGKTRLAVAAAAAVAGDFADGVCYVALAAIGDPRLVAPAIAHALGVRESGGAAMEKRLEAALRERRLLLVLDNFEQVIEAAPLVADLLHACPLLKVMVTSRLRLRISAEHERPVLPLVLTPPEAAASAGGMAQSEAARLFVERALTVRQDLDLTGAHAGAVEAICHRLDGLPLAIELAAARVNVLPPPDLRARLEHRLPLLTGGPRDAPARLRTMRNAIAWSYDLLSADEACLFRRLAVFVGGFTLEAAEALGGIGGQGDRGTEKHTALGVGAEARPNSSSRSPYPPIPRSPASVLDLVAALVEKSLLRAETVAGGATRYSMLETIREFGLEQLAASGEADVVRRRHGDWYLAFAADAGPRAKQPGAAAWLPRLAAEHPNLRAALGWFLEQGDGPRLVRLAGALWPFWQEQGYAGEGYRWLALALDLGREAPAADRLRALSGAGTLAWYLTQVAQAQAWHEQELALARAVEDPVAEAFALGNLAWQAAEQDDLDGAIAAGAASLALARAAGASEAIALALHNLACFTRMHGDLEAAKHHAVEALSIARPEGWDWLVPMILVGFGYTALALGEPDRAVAVLGEALELGVARGDLVDVSTALEGLARVAAAAGQAEPAVRVFGAAATLRDDIAMPPSPTERAYFAPVLAALRDVLGAERCAAAWAAGRALSREEAIAAARALTASPPKPAQLTGREREILRLLAAGERTRAIADALFISPTTVASHLANIYRKLGVDTRAKAVAVAHRHDWV
jgi:excisionase family DNA binding protein